MDPQDEKSILDLKNPLNNQYEIMEDSIIDLNIMENEVDGIIKIRGIETFFKNIKFVEEKLIIVGLVGSGQKGKTFVLNKLVGNPATPTPTKSISCLKKNGILFLDSESFYKSLKKKVYCEEFLKKKATFLKLKNIKENIFQKFILEESKVFIIVLTHLTSSDQTYIQKIISRLKDKEKTIFIVHNYSDLSAGDTIKTKISELHQYFNLKNFSMDEILEKNAENLKREKTYFKEQFSEECYKKLNVYHFILAGDNNQLMREGFNMTTIECMNQIIPVTAEPKVINLEQSFNEFCQKEFLEYFYLEKAKVELKAAYPNINENAFNLDGQSKIFRFENDEIFLKPAIDSLVGDENQYLEFKPYYVLENAKNENENKILKVFFPLDKKAYELNINNVETIRDKNKNKHVFVLSGNRKMYEEVKKVLPENIIENTVQEGNFSLTVEICEIKDNNVMRTCTLMDKTSAVTNWIGGMMKFEFRITVSQRN